MVYDDMTGEYRPSWGFNRVGDHTDDWVVEHNPNKPTDDPFAEKAETRAALSKAKGKRAKPSEVKPENVAPKQEKRLKSKLKPNEVVVTTGRGNKRVYDDTKKIEKSLGPKKKAPRMRKNTK
jgi:hypothetical protein